MLRSFVLGIVVLCSWVSAMAEDKDPQPEEAIYALFDAMRAGDKIVQICGLG